MGIISTIIAVGLGFGIAQATGKKKAIEKEVLLELEKRKKGNTQRYTKNESEKDVIDILNDIAHHGELTKFTLTEVKKGKSTYQYLKNNVLITIKVDEEYLECQVKKDGVAVLEYIYDISWDEYDKKPAVPRSVFEDHNLEEALAIIEDFQYEVNNYYWEELESDFEIIDDIKSVKPIEVKEQKFTHSPEEFSEERNAAEELNRIEKISKEEELDPEVGERVLDIVSKIKKATEEIKTFNHELDLEAKHVYDELIKKDLSKLFNAYLKLDSSNRENYKEQIIDGLIRIENKTAELLSKIESQNIHDIESVLHVIKQRYKE